jgi:hypothetical protein
MAGEIPDYVSQFISDHVDSVELIDVLLLIRRNRTREWTAEEIGQRLYTTAKSAANRLEALRASGLAVAADGADQTTYRYAPRDGALDRAAAGLEEAYGMRRTTVINLIFSKPSPGLRSFADAFRIRDDK